MRGKRRPAPPPNLAAKSLAQGRFVHRQIASAKSYSRKIKHKNRDRDPGSFFC